MSPDNENQKDQLDENAPEDAVEETPQAEGATDETVADGGEGVVVETQDEEPPAEAVATEPADEPQGADAEEADEAPEPAQADATETEPKSKRAAKKRPAEQDADAEQPARRGRGRGRKAEEPKAVPVGVKVSAQAKYVRTSARKARLVCDHIRGKDVEEARAILAFTTRDAAKAWSKLLESAVANAENNHELVGEDMLIYSVHADEGPTLKRYRPRAMGRATRIRKRTSHLSITLITKES